MGNISSTVSGQTCIPWSTALMNQPITEFGFQEPCINDVKNYCRNPGNRKTQPWCYIDNDGQWEYCDIQLCSKCKFVINLYYGTSSIISGHSLKTCFFLFILKTISNQVLLYQILHTFKDTFKDTICCNCS